MGYLFHCPICRYNLCKDCDFKQHGKILKLKFDRYKDFNEESISEFLLEDEIITAFNLDENKNIVWLGTNLGNIISFSSLTLEKKDLIKTKENSKIL